MALTLGSQSSSLDVGRKWEPATKAAMEPESMAVDSGGNLYIADFVNENLFVFPDGREVEIATAYTAYTGFRHY